MGGTHLLGVEGDLFLLSLLSENELRGAVQLVPTYQGSGMLLTGAFKGEPRIACTLGSSVGKRDKAATFIWESLSPTPGLCSPPSVITGKP